MKNRWGVTDTSWFGVFHGFDLGKQLCSLDGLNPWSECLMEQPVFFAEGAEEVEIDGCLRELGNIAGTLKVQFLLQGGKLIDVLADRCRGSLDEGVPFCFGRCTFEIGD